MTNFYVHPDIEILEIAVSDVLCYSFSDLDDYNRDGRNLW